MKKLLTILTLASGMCGIAYELLYARLLTTFFGDMFHVGAAILASFLFGIGVGSFIAHRWARFLWVIEIAIGVYAVVIALAFSSLESPVVIVALAFSSGAIALQVLCVFLLLLLPAILIGFSVPLFTLYREHNTEEGRAAFRVVYWMYNFGAALCVLVLEYIVLRAIGLRGSLFVMAAINVTTGVLLRRIPPPPPPPKEKKETTAGMRLPLAAIGLVSALSAIYQLVFYKLAETIFGPFHENFAIVLVMVLAGLGFGTLLVHRYQPTLIKWLIGGSVVVAVSFLSIHPLIWIWATVNGSTVSLIGLSSLLKILVLALLGGPAFTVFGGTVPVLLREAPSGRNTAGIALGVSSMGNCLGYLLMVLVIFQQLSAKQTALMIVLLTLAAGLVLAWHKKQTRQPWVMVSAIAMVSMLALWPTKPLGFAFHHFISLEALQKSMAGFSGFRTIKRYDSQISIVKRKSGAEVLYINGYASLASSVGGQTNRREMIFGMMPALYSEKREKALVLGLGTGITAGATAPLYDETVTVEINPAIVDLLPYFAEHNGNLHERPGVDNRLDDGLNLLTQEEEKYDAIINTVTSPLFFSSSKLYTRDFFQLAARHLKPGGVYALWFDARVRNEGTLVIFQSLAESFADCHMIFLSPGYCQMICGNELLSPRPLPAGAMPEELEQRFGSDELAVPLVDFLGHLAFPVKDLLAKAKGVDPNTFDHPVLEFMMASFALAPAKEMVEDRPYQLAGVGIDENVFSDQPWSGDDLARRCYSIRFVARKTMYKPCVKKMLEEHQGKLPLAYAEPTLAYVMNTASKGSREHFLMVQEVVQQSEPEKARATLEAHEEALAQRNDFVLLRMSKLLEWEGDLPDEELAELYARSPLSPQPRRLFAQVAEKRGLPEAAQAHLRFLQTLTGSQVLENTRRPAQLGLPKGAAGPDEQGQ